MIRHTIKYEHFVYHVKIKYSRAAFVAQMVERKTLNLVVVGSIPIEGDTILCEKMRTSNNICLYTAFRIRCGRVAQLVERQSNKLPVEGSSPFVTIFIINEHNDHSHTHFLQNIVMKYSDVCHIKNGAKRELNPRPLLP